MEDFVKRIVDEKAELDEKREKLVQFMHSNTYADLTAVEQGLLMVQLEAMSMYGKTLDRRLEVYLYT